jgi:hypothetical protein
VVIGTLIGLVKFKGSGFKPEKSVVAASTGQGGKYFWDPIRTGNHSAFSKGGSIQFFNEFSGVTIKSNCADSYCGSGNKLNTVPIIFTEQSRVSVAQKVAGFLSAKNISTNKNSANIKEC